MKAKDTKWCPQHGYPLPCFKCGMPLTQSRQTEIYKAGMRKVVEWLNKQNTIKLKSLKDTDDWFKHCGLLIPIDIWQAQLEEWGTYYNELEVTS